VFNNDGREFRRNSAQVNLIHDIFGRRWDHEIRAGGVYDDEEDTLRDRLSGGMMFEHVPGDRTLTRYWGDEDDLPVAAVRETFFSTPLSLYVQDRLRNRRFTIGAGVRWTRQPIDFPSGASLDTNVLQPRLHITFDPWTNGRSRFSATFGRFAETLSADERVAMGSKRRYVVSGQRAYGSLASIDPDLRGRYEDELTLGFSRGIGSTMTFAITGIRRRLQSDVQDFFCTADLRRCIGNIDSRRALDAVDIDLTSNRLTLRRGKANWGVHYIWARRTGNVEEPDLAATRTLGIDPYSRIAFDLPEFVPPDAPLARDRRHTARAFGVLSLFKERLTLSASAWWQSGEPRARFGYSELFGRYAYFLTPRGAEGRSPSAWDADTRIAYGLWIREKTWLEFAWTISNARNGQIDTIDDQRWSFAESGLARNGGFLQPMERVGPRTMELSVKLRY
jgi:hypothetical protein